MCDCCGKNDGSRIQGLPTRPDQTSPHNHDHPHDHDHPHGPDHPHVHSHGHTSPLITIVKAKPSE